MIRFVGGRPRAFALVSALAIAAALAGGGCGRNGGDLPAGFAPQGQVGENLLFTQVLPLGGDVSTGTPGVVITIYDRTRATNYRVYRSTDGGPYDVAGLYPSTPAGTFNSGAELFEFVDPAPPLGQPLQYLARGIVDGEETSSAPVTNVASLPASSDPTDLYPALFALVDPYSTQDTLAVVDSLPLFQWEAVTGATRYALQIVRSDGKPFFLGLTPDASTSYQYGSGTGIAVQYRPLTLSTYAWSAAALDASSRIIASTDFTIFRVDTMGFTAKTPPRESLESMDAVRAQLLFGPGRGR